MPGISGATAIAGGGIHSLVLLSDGTVKACGYNQLGQLGDSSTTQRTSPVTVTGLTSVAALVAGANHSGAIRTDSTLGLWGLGASGQIGDSFTTNRVTTTTLLSPTTASTWRSARTIRWPSQPPASSIRSAATPPRSSVMAPRKVGPHPTRSAD